MLARLLDYMRDPDHVGARRILVIAIALVAAGGIAAIASGRRKSPPPTAGRSTADVAAGTSACVCPVCGASIGRVPGRECEELACPRDGTQLQSGFTFGGPPPAGPAATAPIAQFGQPLPVAAPPAPQPAMAAAPVQTLAPLPQALAPLLDAPSPAPQPVYLYPPAEVELTLPPQAFAPYMQQLQSPALDPTQLQPWLAQPPAMRPAAYVPQRPGASDTCVCPRCGSRVPNDGHLYCPGLRCPSCGGSMLAGVRVGTNLTAPPPPAPQATLPAPSNASGRLVAATCGPYGCFEQEQLAQGGLYPGGLYPNGVYPNGLYPGGLYQNGVYPNGLYPGSPYPSGPYTGNPYLGALQAAAAMPLAAAPTYSGVIADIVSRNCLRCHGGMLRSLGTYENVKAYASSGLLAMMIQPGGPMSHFLAPMEAKMMLDWIQTGEPR